MFSPEALLRSNAKDAVIDFSAENIARVKRNMANEVVRLMRDDETIKKAAQKALDLSDLDPVRWTRFLEDGIGNNKSFRDELIEDLFEIDTYNNIL